MVPELKDKSDKRRQILAAAEQLFAHKGFHSTTIDMIAEAASVGKGTVYVYFASKDELMGALLEQHLLGLIEMMNQAASKGSNALEKLRGIVAAHYNFYSSQKEFFILLYDHFGEFPDALKERIDTSHGALEQVVEDVLRLGVKEGVLRQVPLELLSRSLQGMIHATAFEWAIGRDDTSPDVMANEVYDLFCQGSVARK